MATTNYNLPTITGNMNADVVRDMNALAEATDAAIKTAVDGVDLSAVEGEIATVSGDLATHLADKANPHGVTKSQVGLGNVENYGVATQVEAEEGISDLKFMTPLKVKQAITKFTPKNVPNGFLGLDENGEIPNQYKPKRLVKVAEIDFSVNPGASVTVSGLLKYKYLQPVLKGITHNFSASSAIYLTFGNYLDTDFLGHSISATTISALSNRAGYRTDVQASPAKAYSFVEVFKNGLLRTRGIAAATTSSNPDTLSASSYFVEAVLRSVLNANFDTITISTASGQMVSGMFELWGEE